MAKIKMKVDDLYQKGCKYKLINQSPSAAKFMWQALACGKKEAAVELYNIFKEGINIEKNYKAVAVFNQVWKILSKLASEEKWNKKKWELEKSNKIEDKLSFISRKALEEFKGVVTEEIIIDQVKYCDLEICQKFGDFNTMHELANTTIAGEESNNWGCVIF